MPILFSRAAITAAEERTQYTGEERGQWPQPEIATNVRDLALINALFKEYATPISAVDRMIEGIRARIERFMNAEDDVTPVDSRGALDAGVLSGAAASLITRGEWEAARSAGTLIVFYASKSDPSGRVFPPAKSLEDTDKRMDGEIHHARMIKLPAGLTLSRVIPSHDIEDYQRRVGEGTLGFGDEKAGILNADAMALMVHDGTRWMERGEVLPLMEFSVHPNAQVLHYGSALFEGIGCELNEAGEVCIFDIEGHYKRLSEGARQLKFAPLPPFEVFKQMILGLIDANERFIPAAGKGRLYLRPNLVDLGPKLKVGHSHTFVLTCTATPIGNAGSYYGTLNRPKIAAVPINRVRAVPGQIGAAKAAGNYAPTIEASEAAAGLGLEGGVAYLDRVVGTAPRQREYAKFTEMNAANILAFTPLTKGRWEIHMPPLSNGDILAGRTRALILKIAKELGWPVIEAPLVWQKVVRRTYAVLASCGTGAYLTPIHGLQLMEVGERAALGKVDRQVLKTLEGEAREHHLKEHVGSTVNSVIYPKALSPEPTPEELFPEPLRILLREMERVKRGERTDNPELDALVTRHRIRQLA